MSTPNPLMPQGSLPQAKGKSNIKIAMFAILAIHVVLIGGILITQGCKSESKAPEPIAEAQPQPSLDLPPIDQAQELTNSTAYGYADPYAASTQQVSSLPASAPGTQQVSALPPTAPLPGQVTPQTTSQVVPQPYDTSSSVAAETQTHAVAKGESYTTIAKKYGVTIKAIETANPNVEPTRLQIGQKITIPTPAAGNVTASAPASAETAISADTTTYTVKAGDMLEKIARAHGTTVKAIKSLNGLRTDQIKIGQKLKIPATGSSFQAATNR